MSDVIPASARGGGDVPEEIPLSAHGATPELMATLYQASTKTDCTRDEVLFRQGDSPENVYLVLTGEVRLTMPVSSKSALSFHATVGSLVGLPAAFSNEPYSLTAVAKKGARLARISRQVFTAILAANPVFSLARCAHRNRRVEPLAQSERPSEQLVGAFVAQVPDGLRGAPRGTPVAGFRPRPDL